MLIQSVLDICRKLVRGTSPNLKRRFKRSTNTHTSLKGQRRVTSLFALFLVFAFIFSSLAFSPSTLYAMSTYKEDIVNYAPFNAGALDYVDTCGTCHATWSGGKARGNMALSWKIWDDSTMNGMGAGMETWDAFNIGRTVLDIVNEANAGNPNGWAAVLSGPDKDSDGYIMFYFRSEIGMPINTNTVGASGSCNGSSGDGLSILDCNPSGWDIDDNDSGQGNVAWNSDVAGTTTDSTPSGQITDLAIASVGAAQLNLTWTATGDDGSTGTAHSYDVRYAEDDSGAAGDFYANPLVGSDGTPRTWCDSGSTICSLREPAHWVQMWDIQDCGIKETPFDYLSKNGDSTVSGQVCGEFNDGSGAPLQRGMQEPAPQPSTSTENYTIQAFTGGSRTGNYPNVNAIVNGTTYWVNVKAWDGVLTPIFAAGGGPHTADGAMETTPGNLDGGFTENAAPPSNIVAITAGASGTAVGITGITTSGLGDTASENMQITGIGFVNAITTAQLKLNDVAGGKSTTCTVNGGTLTDTFMEATCNNTAFANAEVYDVDVLDGGTLKAAWTDAVTITAGGGDVTPPETVDTLVLSTDGTSPTHTTNGAVLTALAADSDGTVSACDATIDGTFTDGPTASVSGASTPWTCTSSGLTAADGYVATTIKMNATSAGGTTASAAFPSRTFDNVGPASPTLNITSAPSSNQCDLTWSATDAGGGNHLTTPYAVYEGSVCGAGIVVSAAGTATSANPTTYLGSGMTTPNSYDFIMCATDVFGYETSATQTCTTSAAVDVTPPETVDTLVLSTDATSVTHTTDGAVLTALAADSDGTVSACDATVDGTFTDAPTASVSGASTPWTCTSSGLTAADGYVATTIKMNATSVGGTTASAAFASRTFDNVGPESGSISGSGNAQCNLTWSASDSGVGNASGTYTVYESTNCTGAIAYGPGAATGVLRTTYGGPLITNGPTYDYSVCATDDFGTVSSPFAGTCTPSAGPAVSAKPGSGTAASNSATTNSGVKTVGTFSLSVTNGATPTDDTVIDGVTVGRTVGGSAADSDIGTISVYADTNNDGVGDGGAIGTGTFSGGSAVISITNQALSGDGTVKNYTIEYTVSASGNDGTITAGVTAISKFSGTSTVGASSDDEEATLTIDRTAPVTEVNLGSSPSLSTWYATNQTVNLTTLDGTGSGVASTLTCQGNNGDNCSPVTSGTSQSADCASGVCLKEVGFASTDNATNVQGDTYHRPIWIDKELPATLASFTVTGADSSHCALSWGASSDGSGSGLTPNGIIYESTSISNGCSGTVTVASASNAGSTTDDLTVTTGLYYYTYCATDNVGNVRETEIVCNAVDANTTGTTNATSAVASIYVIGGETDVELGSFKITTTDPSDDVTSIDLTFSGADGDYTASSVKVFLDADKDGIHDAGEVTQLGSTTSVSSGAASISGFTIDATLNNEYVIVADIPGTPASASGTVLQAKSTATGKTDGTTAFSNTDAYDGVITIDKTDPTGTIIITNEPVVGFNVGTVDLDLTCTDAHSGCNQMWISNSSGFADGAWEAFGLTKVGWTVTAGDGNKNIYIKFNDSAGNANAASVDNDLTVRDETPPSGTNSIDGGATYTNSTSVTLTLTCGDGTGSSGVACASGAMMNIDGAGWVAYSASPAATLAGGDGSKTVNVDLRDALGNTTGTPVSDTITLDETNPSVSTIAPSGADIGIADNVVITFSETTMDCSTVTANGTVTIAGVSAPDDAACQLGNLTLDSCSSDTATFTHPVWGVAANCQIDVSTGVQDLAGNPISPAGSGTFTVVAVGDTDPTGPLALFNPSDKGEGTTFNVDWTNPSGGGFDSDAEGTLVTAIEGTCGAAPTGGDVPVDGSNYSAGNIIGAMTVVGNLTEVGEGAVGSGSGSNLTEGVKHCLWGYAKDGSSNYSVVPLNAQVIPYNRQMGNLGYNMVSVPGAIVAGETPAALFNDDLNNYIRIRGWNNGYTAVPGDLTSGAGYWLLNSKNDVTAKLDRDQTFVNNCGTYGYGPGACDYDTVTSPFDITLSAGIGWKLIGNPCMVGATGVGSNGQIIQIVSGDYGTQAFAAAVGSGVVKNSIYRWTGVNYSDVQNIADNSGYIQPWTGYWFFIKNATVSDIKFTCGTGE